MTRVAIQLVAAVSDPFKLFKSFLKSFFQFPGLFDKNLGSVLHVLLYQLGVQFLHHVIELVQSSVDVSYFGLVVTHINDYLLVFITYEFKLLVLVQRIILILLQIRCFLIKASQNEPNLRNGFLDCPLGLLVAFIIVVSRLQISEVTFHPLEPSFELVNLESSSCYVDRDLAVANFCSDFLYIILKVDCFIHLYLKLYPKLFVLLQLGRKFLRLFVFFILQIVNVVFLF